jgi:hypothetical protein
MAFQGGTAGHLEDWHRAACGSNFVAPLIAMRGLAWVMRTTALALLVISSGCATVPRQAPSRFDALSDQEIARLAVREALGQLHVVEDVDAASHQVRRGTSAFANREERLAFEARLDQALRSKLTGQAPVLDQLSQACSDLQRQQLDVWPGERLKTQSQCLWADDSLSLHTLWKKPRLHRIYLDRLLEVVDDPDFTEQTRYRFKVASRKPHEGYVFKLGAWDFVEGFRVRG